MFKYKQGGFTLIELIIALSLTAMVLGLLATGMNLLIRDWQRDSYYLDQQLDASLAALQIEQALLGAFPYSYQDEKVHSRYYLFFEGKKDRLAWVSTVSSGRESEQTIWQIEPNQDNKGIRLLRIPALIGDPERRLKNLTQQDKDDAISLFEDYTVRFSYLQPDRDLKKRHTARAKNHWRDKWTAKKYQFLPSAVRITLVHPQNPATSLEIIAPILATEHINGSRFRPKPPSL